MNSRNTSPAGVGVLTVFLILAALALSTLAALAYASARADYRLSDINADTVSAYYAADAEAAALCADFAAGTQAELEQVLPMTATQSLYIHLVRTPDGQVSVLAWNTVAVDDGSGWGDEALDVWAGS